LGDIRVDIDELMAGEPEQRLAVLNLDTAAKPGDERPDSVELVRDGRQFAFSSHTPSEAAGMVAALDPAAPLLITNLQLADLRSLAAHLPRGPRLLGFRSEIGYWLLLGAPATAAPRNWQSAKARPLGMPAIA
jgi:hypothetical protein